MAKLTREAVVAGALDLLDDVGLDAVSTRALARRLGVEQPSLYWHFAGKAELLSAMAAAAMAPHDQEELPEVGQDWAAWFTENSRSFRRTLLAHRDGARLHAGSRPTGASLERVVAKMDFLVASGVDQDAAGAGMLASSRFVVGSALEEQADAATAPGGVGGGFPTSPTGGDRAVAGGARGWMTLADHSNAFEEGLSLIISGMRRRLGPRPGPVR